MSEPTNVPQLKLRPPQRFAHALRRHGVEYLFGQSNPPALTLAAEDLGIRQIGYRQENSGTYMADGYARVTGKVPVVTAQNGPAATLLVAGLAECLSASVPIVAIVQDVGPENQDRNAFQELDQMALFQGVAKWIRRVTNAERIEDYVDMAFTAAASGRPGPAVLLVSMALLNEPEEKPVPARAACLGHYPLDRTQADPANIATAAALLANAHAPIVYAGGGVIGSGAQQELRALQERAHLPVATSTMGKGSVDENHPLSVGVIGYFMATRGMAKFAKPLVTEADVVLLIGNRTNQNGTDSWTLLPRGATYIHIDVDPMEIGRNYEAVRLQGDARLTLAALNAALATHNLDQRRAARAGLESTLQAARASHCKEVAAVTTSDAAPIRPERFMAELEKQLADDHIIAADASFSSIWVANFLAATGTRRFLTPRGQAGLGWGFPMAMGARIGQPERPVCCVVGDGGFGHVWSELETARRHGIKVVVAVMNNAVLGYQKHAEDAGLGRHTGVCDFAPVDHAAIAQACGVTGIRVERAGDIAAAIAAALASPGSVVIDIIADPNAVPPVQCSPVYPTIKRIAMPAFSLNGKTVFITGGASGIGLGTCERFLQEGARVFIADIQAPPQVVLDAGAVFQHVDVSKRDDVIAALAQAEALFGLLDVIIHNAGRPGKGKHLTESDEAVLDELVALNFYGTYYMLKYGPRHMRDGGSIITTASVAGLQQNEGFFDYSATKAATISMTKTAAVELGLRGIRCNTVAPGPVKTPMLPPAHVLNTLAKQLSALGRIAQVDDLVGVYHFLASDDSRYITGHTMVVDGGRLTGFRQAVLARLADTPFPENAAETRA